MLLVARRPWTLLQNNFGSQLTASTLYLPDAWLSLAMVHLARIDSQQIQTTRYKFTRSVGVLGAHIPTIPDDPTCPAATRQSHYSSAQHAYRACRAPGLLGEPSQRPPSQPPAASPQCRHPRTHRGGHANTTSPRTAWGCTRSRGHRSTSLDCHARPASMRTRLLRE